MLKILRLSLLFCLYTQVVSINTMCCRRRQDAATKISKCANCMNGAICTISAIGLIGCLVSAVAADDTAQRCLVIMYSGLNGMVAGTTARMWFKECETAVASAESAEYRNTYYRAYRAAMRTRSEQSRSRMPDRSVRRTMSTERS